MLQGLTVNGSKVIEIQFMRTQSMECINSQNLKDEHIMVKDFSIYIQLVLMTICKILIFYLNDVTMLGMVNMVSL
jgi:hypothetical protein